MDKNIFQRIDAITAELGVVAKNLSVQATKTSSYKAVGERDIIDAVKPLEHKYGVVSYPVSREILDDVTLESEQTYNGNTTKKTTFYIKIRTKYRFVNIDDPKDFIETETISDGIDSGDKGGGKAMTYGDKYALMKMYKISTGEDPDQAASEPEKYIKVTSNTPEKAPDSPEKRLSEEKKGIIRALAKQANIDIEATGEDLDTMTDKRGNAMIVALKNKIGEKA